MCLTTPGGKTQLLIIHLKLLLKYRSLNVSEDSDTNVHGYDQGPGMPDHNSTTESVLALKVGTEMLDILPPVPPAPILVPSAGTYNELWTMGTC